MNEEVQLWLRCAYVPSVNSIIERSHLNIKRIATRKQRTIAEATYWYNVTLKDGVSPVTTPANSIYTYRVQAKGIDIVQSPEDEEVCRPYTVGDPVWMKSPGSQCTTRLKFG